jgi:trigger factor
MNITRENIDDVNIVLKMTVEKPDYEESLATALKEYRQKAVIPGFRPGKIPASLIQKRFGKAFLAEEVNKALSKALTKYIVDEKLPVLGEPLPNEELQKPIDFEKDEAYEFVFDIGLAPSISVNIDKTRKFDYYQIKVDEEMIDSRVESLAYQYGSNKPEDEVTEKALVRGDFVQLGADGQDIENGICPEGVLLTIDLIKDEDVKASFIGKKIGDTLVFDPVKAYNDRHEVGHMLRISHEAADTLESQFRFTIKEISVYKPAVANEEFYKLVYGEESGVATEAGFREKVKEDIALSLKQSADYKFALDTHQNLVDNIEVKLPETLLKRWLKLRNEKLTEEQIEGDFGNFIHDLKWQIIKDVIVKDNSLQVGEEEAMDFARQVTLSQFYRYGMYNATPDQLELYSKKLMENEEEKESIYKKIFEDKVMEVVKEKADIQVKEVSNKEFTEMMK